jgi:hypothetical protein
VNTVDEAIDPIQKELAFDKLIWQRVAEHCRVKNRLFYVLADRIRVLP